MIDRKEGKPLEFDEVELKVSTALRQQIAEVYMGELKKQAKINVGDAALEKL